MKNLFNFFLIPLFLLFASFSLAHVAFASDNLLGIGRTGLDANGNNIYQFVKIDPTTATLTPIGSTTFSSLENTVSALDSVGHRFFFVSLDASYSNYYLSIVNTDNGTATNLLLTNFNVTSLQYDQSSGNLYAIGQLYTSSYGNDLLFMTINQTTGIPQVIKDLGTPSLTNISTFDPIGHRYFAAGYDSNGNNVIYTINTMTVTVAQTILQNSRFVSLQYDPSTDTLFALGQPINDTTFQFETIDPATGIAQVIKNYGSNIASAGYISTLDPVDNRFFFTGYDQSFNSNLYSIDTQNGTIVNTAPDNNNIGLLQNEIVVNTPPTVGTISVSTNPVQVNAPDTAQASFTDQDTSDTHTAIWDWGDGTPTNPDKTTGTVTESNGSGTVGSDTHTYTQAGVYTITLTVIDNHGASGTSIFQYVSVYNPTSQGLFSAGSKYSSPAGAYAQNVSLTGDVKFGLSYKYQGTMPVGDKQFTLDFKAANLTFNATTVSSLVIANGIGTLTGTGTTRGSNTIYNFLVTGSESANTIRIQITDPSNNNNIIYDTQPGDPANAIPTTSVSGHVLAH